MSEFETKEAVIYCRAAGREQEIPDLLHAQETRCREYAKSKGYAVARVFTDEGSGNVIDRPGLQAMLAFLRQHPRNGRVVIADDFPCLGRDLTKLVSLLADIKDAGGRLQFVANSVTPLPRGGPLGGTLAAPGH